MFAGKVHQIMCVVCTDSTSDYVCCMHWLYIRFCVLYALTLHQIMCVVCTDSRKHVTERTCKHLAGPVWVTRSKYPLLLLHPRVSRQNYITLTATPTYDKNSQPCHALIFSVKNDSTDYVTDIIKELHKWQCHRHNQPFLCCRFFFCSCCIRSRWILTQDLLWTVTFS